MGCALIDFEAFCQAVVKYWTERFNIAEWRTGEGSVEIPGGVVEVPRGARLECGGGEVAWVENKKSRAG